MEIHIGDKIGKLSVLSFESRVTKFNKIQLNVICKCECGKLVTVIKNQLKKSRSCGCAWHHKSNTKVYYAWVGMRDRCYDLNNQDYSDYGGRGIIVCKGYHSFNMFYKIMGEPPTKKHSNDRINNNLNYTCGECEQCRNNGWNKNTRWATDKEQAQNKRSNVYLDINGVKICLSEVARKYNIPQSTLWMRLFVYKWEQDKAINKPVNKRKNATAT
jgi:hypothetical protein